MPSRKTFASFAKAGVEMQLRSTAGSVETAALLRDPGLAINQARMFKQAFAGEHNMMLCPILHQPSPSRICGRLRLKI